MQFVSSNGECVTVLQSLLEVIPLSEEIHDTRTARLPEGLLGPGREDQRGRSLRLALTAVTSALCDGVGPRRIDSCRCRRPLPAGGE